MNTDGVKLAVVIPYYKAAYFQDLLSSLVRQTDDRFNVYIGDDYSSDPISGLIAKYEALLTIKYVRFASRLGHISLVRQWERCLALIQGDEEWVWVLPDDDLPSNNCVDEFYHAVSEADKNNVKTFRFPIDLIDATGSVILKNSERNPEFEAGFQYFERAMKGQITTSLGDIIFNRHALLSSGGFVDFPQAWGSDQATVLRVTYGSNIQTLKQGRLGFRMSGLNITSQKDDGLKKIRARIEFALWLQRNEFLLSGANVSLIFLKFARKQDIYFAEDWEFSWAVWWGMYRLRIICTKNYNPLPLVKLLLLRLMRKQG